MPKHLNILKELKYWSILFKNTPVQEDVTNKCLISYLDLKRLAALANRMDDIAMKVEGNCSDERIEGCSKSPDWQDGWQDALSWVLAMLRGEE